MIDHKWHVRMRLFGGFKINLYRATFNGNEKLYEDKIDTIHFTSLDDNHYRVGKINQMLKECKSDEQATTILSLGML